MKLQAPVAGLICATAAALSVCSEFHLIKDLRRSRLTLSYTAVLKRREWWRLVSSLLLFDIDNLFDIWTLVVLYYCMSSLERRLFKGNPSAFLSTIVAMGAVLLAPGYWVRELRFKEPSDQFFQAMFTWALVACYRGSLVYVGPIPVPAAIAGPLFLAYPHISQRQLDLPYLKHQMIAVVVGLGVCDVEICCCLYRPLGCEVDGVCGDRFGYVDNMRKFSSGMDLNFFVQGVGGMEERKESQCRSKGKSLVLCFDVPASKIETHFEEQQILFFFLLLYFGSLIEY
ncbi:unnamed protein product [Choristocarpus tenellus]